MNFDEISALRKHSSAWKLLRADNAPLILSFFEKVFVEDNVRSIPITDLVEPARRRAVRAERAGSRARLP